MNEKDIRAMKDNMTLHAAIIGCYIELRELYMKCHTARDWQENGGAMDVIWNKMQIYSEAA